MGSGRSRSPCPGWHCNGQKARSPTGDHWQYNGHCDATEVGPRGCRHRVHRHSRRRPRRQVVEVAGQLLAARSVLANDSVAPAPVRGAGAGRQLRPGTDRKRSAPRGLLSIQGRHLPTQRCALGRRLTGFPLTRSPSNISESDYNFKLLCGKLELEPLNGWSKNNWSPPAVQRELEERSSGHIGLITTNEREETPAML